MQIHFKSQEGPEKISVFNLRTRTTSSLENYNGWLGKKIPKGGGFFRFVACMQQENFFKTKELNDLINSGGGTKCKDNKKYEVIHLKLQFTVLSFTMLVFV